MATEVRYWRQLERHPLSAGYEDIKGKAWEDFVANFKEHGIVRNRPVTLYEGKIIDGWQLQRACVECDGPKPTYVALKLAKGMTPEEYVETVNDMRRHETQERAMQRRAERIERVAAARQEGQSIRSIAEQEEVSKTQVEKDLKEAGVHGGTPMPPDNKIVGKDGVIQPATKPIETPKKLCRDCRIGPARPRCPKCKELNTPTREPGDDTEAEKEEKRRAKNNGKPTYDWKPFDAAFGAVVRQIDVLGNAYKAKESAEAKELRSSLGEWLKSYKAWFKALSKQKVPNS